MDALLSVESLTVEYLVGDLRAEAVSDVSFEIGHAERVGLVGESGAGKSVVARAIMGLIRRPGRITGGRVVFNGVDLTNAHERVLDRIRGKRIALIPQDASLALNPVLRIGEQCDEVIRRHLRLSGREATRRARETMRRVGLADPDRVLGSFAHELSGGMKQRVAIAMALSCDPELLVADDPTSAVDVTIQAQILKDFRDLTDRLGVAVLFISHDLRVVSSLCSRVVVLYAGQVAEAGPSREILARPSHPYTAALLACAPTVEARANPLPVVPGAPPDAFEVVSGCRFHPRCPRKLDRCETEPPALLGRGHEVACWNPLVEIAAEEAAG
jgi:peptide/nickel transport system ATP-binding protein